MKRGALIFFVSCLAVAFLVNRGCRPELAEVSTQNAVQRQVRYLCVKLLENKIKLEDVCSRPLPEIPELQKHFEDLLVQDGEWYKSHGSNYFPLVDCSGAQPVFTLLNESFVCEADRTRRIK